MKISVKICFGTIAIFMLALLPGMNLSGEEGFPKDYHDLKNPIGYETMKTFLEQVAKKLFITVTIEGRSAENRALYLVNLNRGKKEKPWRIFFIGQQHGDEPAGKDALIYMIRRIADEPTLLPDNIDLWIMPMANPDGAEKDKRRNGNDADLNRDHQMLLQPESHALHKICRRIEPHLCVDCHEYNRNSGDYWEKGWTEWPQIMMDTANTPLFQDELYEIGLRWIDQVAPAMEKAGHNYTRYFVGNTPPEGELRHSTLECDDARNGLGSYDCLSFIIECGINRKADDPDADLPVRVDAYTTLLWQFLTNLKHTEKDMDAVERARKRPLPHFIPTNYFWGSRGQRISQVKVIDRKTRKTISIPTANFMQDRIVKKSVAAPEGYIIGPDHVKLFSRFLDRHGIPYKVLSAEKSLKVEPCRLVRIEDEFDEVYSRYAGRQIVKREESVDKEFPEGSVHVSLDGPEARRAAYHLEPTMLFGIYQFAEFQEIVTPGEILPVYRIVE